MMVCRSDEPSNTKVQMKPNINDPIPKCVHINDESWMIRTFVEFANLGEVLKVPWGLIILTSTVCLCWARVTALEFKECLFQIVDDRIVQHVTTVTELVTRTKLVLVRTFQAQVCNIWGVLSGHTHCCTLTNHTKVIGHQTGDVTRSSCENEHWNQGFKKGMIFSRKAGRTNVYVLE